MIRYINHNIRLLEDEYRINNLVTIRDGYGRIHTIGCCDMVSDVWKFFVEFVFISKRMMVVIAAVDYEDTSQNVKKVIDKKCDARMNRVVYIIVVAVVSDK